MPLPTPEPQGMTALEKFEVVGSCLLILFLVIVTIWL